MKREFLFEIGCEELPASWLPSLTAQLGERLAARLAELRLGPASPVETFSTPRRLVARIARLAERQADLSEMLTGPPVSAAFGPDGAPLPAAQGFARKHGVEVEALARVETPKGVYLAYERQQPGRPAEDVLGAAVGGVLRDLPFPRQMHWDAWLDDGRGELLFGRPIRWLLVLYGGKVVPFAIKRTPAAAGPGVNDVAAAAETYGHRFLARRGRPGRAIKVRSFAQYRSRLADHFVVLDRQERRSRIAGDLDARAQQLGGRIAPAGRESALLEEVPDLVEYPTVAAGAFATEFLDLPAEVLTTAMIHHQHFFPIVDDSGTLMPAFLAVTNAHPDAASTIALNAERVLTARLRDARFFWQADRKAPLASRIDRLDTVLFHKKLGSFRAKADRVSELAAWIAAEAFERGEGEASAARLAGQLAKVDLTTDMVREFPELQGTMGGLYARSDGHEERIWKAIYHHYLPAGIEPSSPPSREDLGPAAIAWAAVALADKLDTVAGLFAAGERPTGSRDPFGLRRQAHGIFKILVDLPELTALPARPAMGPLLARAARPFGGDAAVDAEIAQHLGSFLHERLAFVLEQRGFDVRNVRAVIDAKFDPVRFAEARPVDARRKLAVLPEFTESPEFRQLATTFKRVRNIARELQDGENRQTAGSDDLGALLTEPAERRLLEEIARRQPVIERVVERGDDYRLAFGEAARFGPAVDRFFVDVFVMVDDAALRTARLRLMKRLETLILKLADVSEIVQQTD